MQGLWQLGVGYAGEDPCCVRIPEVFNRTSVRTKLQIGVYVPDYDYYGIVPIIVIMKKNSLIIVRSFLRSFIDLQVQTKQASKQPRTSDLQPHVVQLSPITRLRN